jgi:hypothetical protein
MSLIKRDKKKSQKGLIIRDGGSMSSNIRIYLWIRNVIGNDFYLLLCYSSWWIGFWRLFAVV